MTLDQLITELQQLKADYPGIETRRIVMQTQKRKHVKHLVGVQRKSLKNCYMHNHNTILMEFDFTDR